MIRLMHNKTINGFFSLKTTYFAYLGGLGSLSCENKEEEENGVLPNNKKKHQLQS